MNLVLTTFYSLKFWLTSDGLLKHAEQFLRDQENYSIELKRFECRDFVNLYSPCKEEFTVVLVDEGQLDDIRDAFLHTNVMFFILSTPLSPVQSLGKNVFWIKSLDELFNNFELMVGLSQKQYVDYVKQSALTNLKRVMKKSMSKEFTAQLEEISNSDKENLNYFHTKLINMEKLTLEIVQELFSHCVDGQCSIQSIQTTIADSHKNLQFIPILLPFLKTAEQDSALIMADGEIPFLLLAKLRILLSFFRSFEGAYEQEFPRYKILESFPFPLGLLREDENVFYNKRLIELNISSRDLQKMDHLSLYERQDKKFTVLQSSFGPFQLYIFYPYTLEKREKNISSQELGIVTSSIAHELNNPLAGILSAVTVLKLEIFWSDDDQECLDDIRVAAIRSKQIVETFLGFSRSALPATKSFFLQELIEQSLELIRFRSAELDVRINLQFKTVAEEPLHLQGPIVTMLFYLIFSELLTLFNHENLISEHGMNEHVINIEVTYHDASVEMNLPGISPKVLTKLAHFTNDSRLIEHLLSLLNHQIIISADPNKILWSHE